MIEDLFRINGLNLNYFIMQDSMGVVRQEFVSRIFLSFRGKTTESITTPKQAVS